MAHYRKKPLIVEAQQWFPGVDIPGVEGVGNAHGLIETLEGFLMVSPGDWVIRGTAGELHPCKPDIFEATYEPVNNEPT